MNVRGQFQLFANHWRDILNGQTTERAFGRSLARRGRIGELSGALFESRMHGLGLTIAENVERDRGAGIGVSYHGQQFI